MVMTTAVTFPSFNKFRICQALKDNNSGMDDANKRDWQMTMLKSL